MYIATQFKSRDAWFIILGGYNNYCVIYQKQLYMHGGVYKQNNCNLPKESSYV